MCDRLRYAAALWPTSAGPGPVLPYVDHDPTALLNDGAPGDTATWVTLPLGFAERGHITAVADLGVPVALTRIVAYVRATNAGEPNTEWIASLEFFGSVDGVDWGTPSLGQVGTVGVDAIGGPWLVADTQDNIAPDGGAPGVPNGQIVPYRYWAVRLDSVYWELPVQDRTLQFADLRFYGPGGAEVVPPCINDGSEANELPQCSTRAFAVDAAPVAPLTAALWEIRHGAAVLDVGDRYDRFGPNGWGVIPALGGVGTLGVTAPGPARAPVGQDYAAITGGQSTTFDVVPGACAAPLLPRTPPMFVFSTGLLFSFLRLPAPAVSRVAVGAPAAAASPVANVLDASLATVADLPRADGANYRYLAADLGAAREIGLVRLANVTSADGSVRVYVSAAPVAAGDFSAATELVPVIALPAPPLSGADLRFRAAAGGDAVVSGRYVYVVPDGGVAGVTLGDLDVRGRRTPFAQLQQIGISVMFEEATLRDACWLNQFVVASADYDGAIEITAQWARFAARSLEALIGAEVSGEAGAETLLSVPKAARPPAFVADMEGRTTDGRLVRFEAWECHAPNFNFQAGRNAFAVDDFRAAVYLSDATGPVARLTIQE